MAGAGKVRDLGLDSHKAENLVANLTDQRAAIEQPHRGDVARVEGTPRQTHPVEQPLQLGGQSAPPHWCRDDDMPGPLDVLQDLFKLRLERFLIFLHPPNPKSGSKLRSSRGVSRTSCPAARARSTQASASARLREVFAPWFQQDRFLPDLAPERAAEGVQAFLLQALAARFCALHNSTSVRDRLAPYLSAWLDPGRPGTKHGPR